MKPELVDLLLIVEMETRKEIDRFGRDDSLDLRKASHRKSSGALTPRIAKHFPELSASTIRRRLHHLKDADLLEYYMPFQSTVRWFPVSLIP